jgi:hypothetical protein
VNQSRLNRGQQPVATFLCAGDLANRAIEQLRIFKVDRLEHGDGTGGNIGIVDRDTQAGASENRELRSWVESIDIFRRVGFGEAEPLRFRQSFSEGNARALDSRQDVIAGPVEDAAELDQFIAGETFLEPSDDGNATRHGRTEGDVLIVFAG